MRLDLMTQIGSTRGCDDEQESQRIWQKSTARFAQPHNAITLSCKSRLPCRHPKSGTAAAATNNAVAGANCSRRAAGVQFGAAQGGSAAEPGLGGFCQLVRAVRRYG